MFTIALIITASILAVFCVYRGINPILCLIVGAESALATGVCDYLVKMEWVTGAGYYVWFGAYCLAHLFVSFLCAIIAASVESKQLKKSAIAVSFIYILSAIYTLFTLIESIPVEGVYPLDFLGLYENYGNAARVFIVLILLVLFLYSGSKGNGTRITANSISDSSSSDGLYLFDSADNNKHFDTGK